MFEAIVLAAIMHTATPTSSPAEARQMVNILTAASTPPAGLKEWSKCILKRETGAALHNKTSRQDAKNETSSASGRWQFLDAWQQGLPYMVKERLMEKGMSHKDSRNIRIQLSAKPIRQWPGIYQDVGAFEVMSRGGFHHWAGHSCGAPY